MTGKVKMKLTKIKLINWHLFTDNEINVNGNLLITGDNGNGKSTLIDAIFYILSGGDERNFNVAANVAGDYGRSRSSERTLASYMRGKLGSEGKEFLRNDASVITHIALEFYDEHEIAYNVLGCVLAIENSSKPKEKFYIARKCATKDLKFVENDGNILNFSAFKTANPSLDITQLAETNSGRRTKIAQFMEITNAAKYFDLLQAAVAFKPINSNVSDFVFCFLLKEDDIDISSLATELTRYREMRDIIEGERRKIECLESFIQKAETYVENIQDIKYLDILSKEREIARTQKSLMRIEEKIAKIDQERNDVDRERQTIEDGIRSLDSEIINIEQGEGFKNIRENEFRLKQLNDAVLSLEEKKDEIESRLMLEEDISKNFGLSYDFFKYINSGNIAVLNKYLEEYREDMRTANEKLSDERVCNNKAIEACENEKYDLNRQLHFLNSGKDNYPNHVRSLKAVIQSELKKKYGIDVDVKPLCECIEVNDKEWTNAIEGYLGPHRFDLIISSEYFYDAAEIYERNVHSMGLYGVSVVNTGAPAANVDERSLYGKIRVLNPNANAICTKLLGRIICVDGVRDFKPGKSYITRTCMVYSNDAVNAINPKNFAVPFIGEDSVIERIKLLNSKLKEAEKQLSELGKAKNEIRIKTMQIGNSKPPEKSIPDYWAELKSKRQEIENLNAHLSELKANKDIVAEATHLDELRSRREEKYAEQSQFKAKLENLSDEKHRQAVELGKLDDQLEKLTHTYNLMVKDLPNKKEYELFTAQFLSSGRDAESEIVRRRKFNDANADLIKIGMREYVKDYNANLSAEIELVSDFIAEYHKIKERSLANNEAQAKQAFENAQMAFNENFISKLRSKIQSAENTLKDINKSLKRHPFGRDKEVYSFVMEDSGDSEMRDYAKIIMSGKEMGQKDLFTDLLSVREKEIMQSLFDKLAAIGDSAQLDKELEKYLDYRQYKSYDIVIENERGEKYYFSKINKEKSGGEMQTPFYVIIGACFNQLLKTDEIVTGACIAVFDEAFNNMDQPRTITLMEYYKRLNIQLIIVVPTNHSQSVIPYVDTVVSLVKKDNVINEAYLYNNG